MFLTIFLILDLIFEHFTGKDFFGNNDGARYNRLSGPFGDEWIVGFFLLYFGFLSLGFFIKFHKIKKIVYFLFSVTLIYTIYLTGERNAFFSSLIFIILLIFLDSKYRKIFSLSLFTITLLFIVSNKYGVVENKYSFKAINQINDTNVVKSDITNDNDPKLIDKIRKATFNNQWVKHYQSAFEIFRDNPFFGSGFRSFKNVCHSNEKSKQYLCSSHPHNIYFELFLYFLHLIYKLNTCRYM